MRSIFEFFSAFDVITPAVGLIQDFRHDPTPLQTNSWTFFIPYESSLNQGWNAADIEALMKAYGIKTWGSEITNGDFFFSVSKNQARWAEYVLCQRGIPIHQRSLGAPPLNDRKE